ncbi:hypothetical protein, partial [Falsiroseomonas oryzae]|uniref:hypothetical protein n=1 Tax=Falsiroseomonas oryzae TaxID=2766473 RepID=UPI0022EB52FC
ALHAALGAGSAPSGAEGCVALLARHAGHGHPPLCRHDGAAVTVSCAVFEPRARRLRLSRGNPCGGDLLVASLPSAA